jgi:hypothetical protein
MKNMKNIICYIICIALLSGCAKVTQESAPCTGTPPAAPTIQDVVILPGSQGYALATNYAYTNDRIVFTGPNNFSQVTNTAELNLDFSNTTNYGTYTAIAYVNGCASAASTFNVLSSFAGNPPCTVSASSYNELKFTPVSGGSTIQFAFYGAQQVGGGSYYCSVNEDIQGTTSNGLYIFDCNLNSLPTSGTYSNLVNSCNSLGNSQAYVTISNGGYIDYQSVSGKVYCNVIGGTTYLTFCGSTFTRVSDNTTWTVTGNIQWQ